MRFDGEHAWKSFPDTDSIRKLPSREPVEKLVQRIQQENAAMPHSHPAFQERESAIEVEKNFQQHTSWKDRVDAIKFQLTSGATLGKEILPHLEQALTNSLDNVRLTVVEILGMLDENISLALLKKALDDSFWLVRVTAVQSLGSLREHVPIKDLLHLLRSEEDESVRETIVYALGKCVRQVPADIFVSILYDENWLVRQAAAWVLSQYNEDHVVKQLIRVLHTDIDEMVRAEVARSLGRLRRQEAVQPLLETSYADEEEVRIAATEALQQISESIDTVTQQKERAEYDTSIDIPFDELPAVQQQKSIEGYQGTQEDLQKRKEEAFFTLTDLMKDKKGCEYHRELMNTNQGQVLYLQYLYKHTECTLTKTALQFVRSVTSVESIEAALTSRDQIVREVVEQALKVKGNQHSDEMLVVSLNLVGKDKKQNFLRVVVSGIGCSDVCSDEAPILHQILQAVEEPAIYPQQHDLADFKIWYRSASCCSIHYTA